MVDDYLLVLHVDQEGSLRIDTFNVFLKSNFNNKTEIAHEKPMESKIIPIPKIPIKQINVEELFSLPPYKIASSQNTNLTPLEFLESLQKEVPQYYKLFYKKDAIKIMEKKYNKKLVKILLV